VCSIPLRRFFKLRHWPPGTSSLLFVPSFSLGAQYYFSMPVAAKILTVLVTGFLIAVGAFAQFSGASAPEIPAYNVQPPTKPLPAILSGAQLSGRYFHYAWQRKVYVMAAKIPAVLHQLPCYCHCDRALGHNSLHSCFEGTHGAVCDTCAKEAAYAYKMTREGKTPKQIREGIERGEWQQIDLNAI